jgi:hypothetical protein
MKILSIMLFLSSVLFAGEFQLKAKNIGDDIAISVSNGSKDIQKFNLRNMLQEGINMKHRSFKYNNQNYVLNIFANMNFIEKNELSQIERDIQCSRSKSYQKTYEIKSEISFSISLALVDNGYLRQLEVVENKDLIEFKKRFTYRCKVNP